MANEKHEFNRTDGYGKRYCQKCGAEEEELDTALREAENENEQSNT